MGLWLCKLSTDFILGNINVYTVANPPQRPEGNGKRKEYNLIISARFFLLYDFI